jgi:hypothetical protein
MGTFGKAKGLAGKYAKKGLDKAGEVRADRQDAAAHRDGLAAEAADLSPHHFTQEVVGESHYQKALEKAVGRQKDRDGSYWRGTAEIRHDDKNKHDRWAIGGPEIQRREPAFLSGLQVATPPLPRKLSPGRPGSRPTSSSA